MHTSQAFGFSSSFQRVAGAIRSDSPLSDDQIRRAAPSVFAAEAHVSRSARYVYLPTIDILQGLRREGFEAFSVTQARARTEDKREHAKHLIRLRHVSKFRPGQVGDSLPEIVLLNSHDGSSSYRMMGGMFRLWTAGHSRKYLPRRTMSCCSEPA